MGHDVEAWQQIDRPQHLANGDTLLEDHLVFTFVAVQPYQHASKVLHHAYDGDAQGSA